MKKTANNKENKKPERTELQNLIAELSEINQKREKDLLELDRIAKLLVRRDLELTEMREGQIKELQEMDRIAKMLVRRDLELSEVREQREKKFQELERSTKELTDSRKALMNILEDVEIARVAAVAERDKTLALIENFADGLLVFDRENKIALINPQAEQFFAIKAKDIVGQPILTFLKLSKVAALEHLTEVLGRDIKKVFRKEVKVKENLILEVSTVPVFRERERLGTLVILHDITREKAIERMKTEFVSLAAHQLRTPLSAIKWTLRMLLDGDIGTITNEQRNFIEKTYQSNERMINLINDLLDVTRIEEGRYLYKPTLARIEDVVQFVLNSYKEEIVKRQIKFILKLPKEKLPRVKIDIEKIRLAIQNLVDNALRYTPAEGTVTIILKYVKKEIEFSVKDTGIGIPQDQQQRVFDKFFRGANAIRMETEGSGLGLYITKNIIEVHGGKIWFESKEDKGTTFYFTLPIKPVAEFEKFVEGF